MLYIMYVVPVSESGCSDNQLQFWKITVTVLVVQVVNKRILYTLGLDK